MAVESLLTYDCWRRSTPQETVTASGPGSCACGNANCAACAVWCPCTPLFRTPNSKLCVGMDAPTAPVNAVVIAGRESEYKAGKNDGAKDRIHLGCRHDIRTGVWVSSSSTQLTFAIDPCFYGPQIQGFASFSASELGKAVLLCNGLQLTEEAKASPVMRQTLDFVLLELVRLIGSTLQTVSSGNSSNGIYSV